MKGIEEPSEKGKQKREEKQSKQPSLKQKKPEPPISTPSDRGIEGVSKFISDTVENYDEYAGLEKREKEKIKKPGNFEIEIEEILDDIQNKIGNTNTSSREYANYQLTTAKLNTLFKPIKDKPFKYAMARYCNAKALNSISDDPTLDIFRFYCNEAFSLEDSYSLNEEQVPLYLLSCCDDKDLAKKATLIPALNHALEKIWRLEFNTKCWENILLMFICNKNITHELTAKLYDNPKLKELSLKALAQFGVKGLTPSISKGDFEKAWNNAKNTRSGDYKRTKDAINALVDNLVIDNICPDLSSLNKRVKNWMTELDKSRINTIVGQIQPAIGAYLASNGYRKKVDAKNSAMEQIEQLIKEIKNGPTKLSYETLLPLLEKIRSLMVTSFSDYEKICTPKITIKLLSPKTLVNDNDEATIQVSVANDKDSSPIKEVSVKIGKSNKVKPIDEEKVSRNPIDGGEKQIFKLKIKLSGDVIVQKATSLNITCQYKDWKDKVNTKRSTQTLSLYSTEEYSPIDNPYSPWANGNTVENPNMFFGRDEFIANIADAIIKAPSKQFIIYGQKRSGKSSVLHHLRKKLMDTGKTFCVFFNLGDISGSLKELTFYHKILAEICDELKYGTYDNVPEFSVPSISDFENEDKYNPSNTFKKYLVKFKLACQKTPGWEEKKLVIMIDEFTYLYSSIKEGKTTPAIMKQWKAITQDRRAQFSAVLVGHDVVPSFKKEDYATNAFGVIEDIRLTYLNEKYARELIENPIGKNRYVDDAVSKIIEYTSRNPYYIQIFCARLVDYMNDNKRISVTDADVEDVARSFVEGTNTLGEDKFDNLIRAGEKEEFQEFPDKDILAVLKQIAQKSKNMGYCKRGDIDAFPKEKEKEDKILKHLVDREVLEMRDNNYKIQVKLFQEWLLK